MKIPQLIKYLILGFSIITFTACEKTNVDDTLVKEEEVITEVINCNSNSWQMVINDDGFGNLTPNSNGGTPPYTYLWSTGDSTANITVTVDGVYSLTMTDAQGCTVSNDINVVLTNCQTFMVVIDASSPGTLSTTETGGTAPYIYLWSTGETLNSINWSVAGTYSVTVTDAGGCVATDEVAVGNCGLFECQISESPIGSGSLAATAIFGMPPYTYEWSTGNWTSNINVTTSGTYSVTVTDAYGCVTTDDITITMPGSCPGFTATIFETSPGSFVLDALTAGGTPPYSYIWSTGQTIVPIMANSLGTYSITITDSAGCTATDDIQL